MDKRTKLKNKLSELLFLLVESKQDLEQWYRLAHKVEAHAKLAEIELPHLVWHYLSDADIRFKGPEYGQEQIEAVQLFIESLECESKNA